jgi:hypothetical protein
MGRKIVSGDAARVLEIIGRPDAAALIVSADRERGSGTRRMSRNESCCEPRGFLGVDLGNKASKTA